KKIVAVVIILVCVLNIIFNFSIPSQADNILGTNAALGSPLLNQNALADDWNKDEALVWGIFLSNFCIPFIDDYESCFNTNSASGSMGRGAKALSFSTGSDNSTTKVIQDLTTYAINNKDISPKPIYVSWNLLRSDDTTGEVGFVQRSTYETVDADLANTTGASVTSTPQHAKLIDLFFQPAIGNSDVNKPGTTGTYVATTKASVMSGTYDELDFGNDGLTLEISALPISFDNDFKVKYNIQNCNLPTFALGTDKMAKVILDYTDSYDIQMFNGSLSSALSSSYPDSVKDVLENIDPNMATTYANSPLYMDSYGNICARINNRYIVIIPAACNQYLKGNRDQNLINSIIFNCNTSSSGTENIQLAGGDTTRPLFIKSKGAGYEASIKLGYVQQKEYYVSPFGFNSSNKMSNSGGMIIYTDTELIDGNNTSDKLKNLFSSDITDNIKFRIEPINISDKIFNKISDNGNAKQSKAIILTTCFTISAILDKIPNRPVRDRLDILTLLKNGEQSEDVSLFDEEDAYVVTTNIPSGINSSGKLNDYAVYRLFISFVYGVYTDKIRNLKDNYGNNITSMVKTEISSVLDSNKSSGTDIINALMLNSDGDDLSDTAKAFINYRSNKGNSSYILYNYDPSKLNESKPLYEADFLSNSSIIGTLTQTAYASANFKSAYTKNFAEEYKPPFIVSIPFLEEDNFYAPVFNTMLTNHVAKVFRSGVFGEVADVLGIREGTEFAAYAPSIYYSYLKWYGIKKNPITGEPSSDINFDIVNSAAQLNDITEITASVKSGEDMQRETLNYAYLALHPTQGRDYRGKVTLSNISSFVYTEYLRIVYGSADEFYNGSIVSRNAVGFLDVPTYSENFLTAPFMEIYSMAAIVMIVIGTVIVLVVAALRKRKAGFRVLGVILVISTVLILPSSGEYVPYISNRVVENLFSDNMTFWSISEQATNYNQINKYNNSLSEDANDQVKSLVNSLSYLYLDRYLTVKQDISQKVTQTDNQDYSYLQQFKSTRWMLPVLLRQWTNNDGTADYIYVSVGDELDDASNVYFYYRPSAKQHSNSLTSSGDSSVSYSVDNTDKTLSIPGYALGGDYSDYPSFTLLQSADDGESLIALDRSTLNLGVKHTDLDTTIYDERTTINAVLTGLDGNSNTFRSSSNNYANKNYTIDPNNEIYCHNYFYIIDTDVIGAAYTSGVDSLKIRRTVPSTSRFAPSNDYITLDFNDNIPEYARAYSERLVENGNAETLKVVESYIENVMGAYYRYEPDSLNQTYGYLMMTESPLPYFYANVFDSVKDNYKLSNIVYALQGDYVKSSAGKEYRKTFMTDPMTGEVKDILDLENLFTNAIPYMYAMQLYAGGYNGEGGVFRADEKYDNKNIYNYNVANKLWIFRSNWVTKIMENPEYNRSAYITKADGTRVKIQSMVMPEYYPADRPMVFSRAQMIQQGLAEEDLNLVELKCIKLNEDMEKKWTLVLNYISVEGMNRDIILRQMALDSTLEFCKTFSPSGLTLESRILYPQSLDLRQISFDSIMKVLMINSSRKTSYINGDSMASLIDDGDIFLQIILLINAFVCAICIPFVRDTTLAILFYSGLIAIMLVLFKDPMEKTKTSIGYVGCHFLMLLINLAY
ncbi:MAG: hypothetical protein IJ593_09050, partial [Lachnospiraceae bacterium]|nr:hypothetical protein [Lachnospiraceae bacterium]